MNNKHLHGRSHRITPLKELVNLMDFEMDALDWCLFEEQLNISHDGQSREEYKRMLREMGVKEFDE